MLTAAVAAAATAIPTGVFAWRQAKSNQVRQLRGLTQQLEARDSQLSAERREHEESKQRIQALEERVRSLSDTERKYEKVKEKLQKSDVVRKHHQPVILLGPRGVGKTSLLMQWYSPWDQSRLSGTQRHKEADVPLFDFKQDDAEPHFADEDVITSVHHHLVLRVHDFPGELSSQKEAAEVARRETLRLKRVTRKSLGLVGSDAKLRAW